MRRGLVAALLLLAACGAPVRFERDDGTVVRTFARVRWATTAAERRAGLTGLAPLAADEAMVLDFPVTDSLCVTNEGVGFAIVASFVAPDGAVVGTERFEAFDARTPCHDGARQVVETDAAGAPGATRVRF